MQQDFMIKEIIWEGHKIRTAGAYLVQRERATEGKFRPKEMPTTGSLTVARPGEEVRH
jgi:hypothetical protein